MFNNFEAEARSGKMKFSQKFLRKSVQSGFFVRSTPGENLRATQLYLM